MKRRDFINLSGVGILTSASLASARGADAASKPLEFLVPPYLQNPTPNSMTILWLVNRRDSLSWVEYGEGEDLNEKAYAVVDGLVDADDHVHKVQLSGLKPGSEYSYRVRSRAIDTFGAYDVRFGDTVESNVHRFRTPLVHQEEVTCVVYNDVHENMPLFRSLHEIASKQDYDFAIFNGDVMNHIDEESQLVDRALKPFADLFASEIPYVYTRGNHDVRGRFARKLNDYIATPGGANYYSFDYGPIHFIVMDLGEDKPDDHPEYGGLVNFGPYRQAQREWLRTEIESHACRQAPFRVLVAHIPLCGEAYASNLCKELWGDLLNKGHVDLHLAGHTHRYASIPTGEDKLDCPIIIGGGRRKGRATVMRLTANRNELTVVMTRDDGEVVAREMLQSRNG